MCSETVKKVLFPVLREDDVTRCIRYDKLLITFANNYVSSTISSINKI